MEASSKSELVARLENAKNAPERVAAAVAMGWDGAPEFAPLLVSKLKNAKPNVAEAYCAALEMIAEPGVVDTLLEWLRECPDEQVWNVCHVLGRLQGVDPLIPTNVDVPGLRDIWLRAFNQEATASIKGVSEEKHFVRFGVDHGRSQVRIDYDAPMRGTSNWGRWNRSLLVGGQPLYSVSSTCGTCETILVLTGFPADHALELSRELSATLQDSAPLGCEWVRSWTPLLTQLQTGHYLAATLSLTVERVDSSDASWMTRRYEFREDDPEWPDDGEPSPWPGTPHFQGPMFAEPLRTYWVTLPSQDLAALDEERVQFYMQRIRHGHRPSALALGWMEDRYVQAEWNERVVATVLLDGHHKMEAYARLNEPASLIALFHLDSTWGPREDPSRPLLQALAQLSKRQAK